ncbi:MAG: Calx-beta domain-containing protein [Anaerolineae bacterium]
MQPWKLLKGLLPTAIMLIIFAAQPVQAAADLTVTITADNLDPADGECTLREAITAANQDSLDTPVDVSDECLTAGSLGGKDTVLLPSGNYQIGIPGTGENNGLTGDFDIRDDIRIEGLGGSPVSARIRGANLDRVCDIINPGGEVELVNLTLYDGQAERGAGIRNGYNGVHASNLLLDNVIVARNGDATTLDGGGIYHRSEDSPDIALFIVDSTFTQNQAVRGAGLFTGAAEGAGLSYNVTIARSIFYENTASNDNPGSPDGQGGAYFNYTRAANTAEITIRTSIFDNNTAVRRGGAIFVDPNEGQAALTIETSQINNNRLLIDGGRHDGGGVWSSAQTFVLDRTTVTNNAAGMRGGGVFSSGDVTRISTSTIINNSAGSEGTGLYLIGGVTVESTTIASNEQNELALGLLSEDVIAISTGSAFFSGSDAVLSNTLLGDNNPVNCFMPVESTGGNAVESFAECLSAPTNDNDYDTLGIVNLGPELTGLADHGGTAELPDNPVPGGPTFPDYPLTAALELNSVLIDIGTIFCPTPAQTGDNRPTVGFDTFACDPGADEYTQGDITFTFSQANYVVNEDDGSVTLEVVRTGDLSDDIDVEVSFFDGGATAPDLFDATPQIVNFDPGETSEQITVPIVDRPLIYDGDLGFRARITDLTLGGVGAPHPAVITIMDNNLPLFNGSFEDPLSNWTPIGSLSGSEGRFQTGGAFDGSHIFRLDGDGSTEGVRQTIAAGGSLGDIITLTYHITGQSLPVGGFIAAQVELLSGGSPVDTATCLVADRGTFSFQQETCSVTATTAFDEIRVSLGWQNVTGGTLGFDLVSAEQN